MYSIGTISMYSRRWQCAIILLEATRGKRGIEKVKVIEKIRNKGWFDFCSDDNLPYPSQQTEPRWVTFMSWTHGDCMKQGLWASDRNDWAPTIQGENFFC